MNKTSHEIFTYPKCIKQLTIVCPFPINVLTTQSLHLKCMEHQESLVGGGEGYKISAVKRQCFLKKNEDVQWRANQEGSGGRNEE